MHRMVDMRISRFKSLGDYTVELEFGNGERRIVDLERYLQGEGVFAMALEPDVFNKMFIEEGGGLAWPSGVDLCPNMLYHNLPPSSAEA